MNAILVRGLPQAVRKRIQKLASAENLSLNQAVIRLLMAALKRLNEDRQEGLRRQEVFERIERLRLKLRQRYGKFDDSTKLIREDRDSR